MTCCPLCGPQHEQLRLPIELPPARPRPIDTALDNLARLDEFVRTGVLREARA